MMSLTLHVLLDVGYSFGVSVNIPAQRSEEGVE
jgi:hypothetical protein